MLKREKKNSKIANFQYEQVISVLIYISILYGGAGDGVNKSFQGVNE